MALMKLTDRGESISITLPKDDLRRDGLVDDDGELVEDVVAAVDRESEGCYLIQVDPDLPGQRIGD